MWCALIQGWAKLVIGPGKAGPVGRVSGCASCYRSAAPLPTLPRFAIQPLKSLSYCKARVPRLRFLPAELQREGGRPNCRRGDLSAPTPSMIILGLLLLYFAATGTAFGSIEWLVRWLGGATMTEGALKFSAVRGAVA